MVLSTAAKAAKAARALKLWKLEIKAIRKENVLARKENVLARKEARKAARDARKISEQVRKDFGKDLQRFNLKVKKVGLRGVNLKKGEGFTKTALKVIASPSLRRRPQPLRIHSDRHSQTPT